MVNEVDDSIRGGLVAYWSFDEGLEVDIGDDDYDAVSRNGATTDASGKFGNAADLSRDSQQYLLVSHPVMTPSSDHAYSAWYRMNDADIDGNDRYFVLESIAGTEPSSEAAYSISYGLRRIDDANHGQFYTLDSDGDHPVSFPSGACNSWHNIIVNFDAEFGGVGYHTIYLDGELVGDMVTYEPLVSTGGLIIGAERSATNRHFDGQIDDVAVWSRTLSAAEIRGLQSAPVATASPESEPDGPVGGVYTVTFATGTTPASVECGTTWSEGGLVLTAVPGRPEDLLNDGPCDLSFDSYHEACSFHNDRLEIDLTGIAFDRVVVNYIDQLGRYTRAALYSDDTIVRLQVNTDSVREGTFTLRREGETVDTFALAGIATHCTEIRVYMNP